jgi:hypothetical protein
MITPSYSMEFNCLMPMQQNGRTRFDLSKDIDLPALAK